MRAASLLSALILICGVAALFGVPAVYSGHRPVFGLNGLLMSLIGAAIPPLVVLAWRKMQRK
jgi:hypothetical protein